MKTSIFIHIIIIFSFLSCSKNKLETNNIGIIGHGGVGFQSARNVLPHNSMESMRKALSAYKIDGVEVDVQLSKDGTLWMYHDEELWSMTLCESCISESSDEVLENCRYRNDFAVNVTANYRLAKLEELFAYHQKNQLESIILLDMRTVSKCISNPQDAVFYKDKIAEKIVALIAQYQLEEYVWIGAPDIYFLEKVYSLNSSLLLFLEFKITDEIMAYALEKNFFKGFVLKDSETNEHEIETLRELNFTSIIFGIKSTVSHRSAINKKPDYIMSDNVQLSLNALK